MGERKYYIFSCTNGDDRIFGIVVHELNLADAWKAVVDETNKVNCDLKESKLVATTDNLIVQATKQQ